MRQTILIFVFLSLLIGCSHDVIYKVSSKNSPFKIGDFNTVMDVSLLANYKDGKLTITVVNQNTNEIEFGREYLLEKQVDDNWKMMRPADGTLAFKSVGYRADSNDQFTYIAVVGDLKKGTYRIIKKDLSVKGSKKEFIESSIFKVH